VDFHELHRIFTKSLQFRDTIRIRPAYIKDEMVREPALGDGVIGRKRELIQSTGAMGKGDVAHRKLTLDMGRIEPVGSWREGEWIS